MYAIRSYYGAVGEVVVQFGGIVRDLLLEQRVHHHRRGAGVLEFFHAVERVGERSRVV